MASQSSWKRWGAVFAAAAIHAALYGVIVATGAPSLKTLPLPPEGEAISVNLVGFSAPSSAGGGSPAAASELDSLQHRLAQGDGGAGAPSESARGSLSDLLGPPARDGPRGAGTGVIRGGDARDQISLVGRGGPRVPLPEGQPCWRKPAAPLPVVMQVLLDDRDRLVGRPRLLRGGGGAAEEQAWRALAGCAPYVAAAPGRYRAFELDFARAAGWITPAGAIEVR